MALRGFLWIPDFPCWAAARADPTLHERPFGVYCNGRLLAVSSAAAECGVLRGWTAQRALTPAREKCCYCGAVRAFTRPLVVFVSGGRFVAASTRTARRRSGTGSARLDR